MGSRDPESGHGAALTRGQADSVSANYVRVAVNFSNIRDGP